MMPYAVNGGKTGQENRKQNEEQCIHEAHASLSGPSENRRVRAASEKRGYKEGLGVKHKLQNPKNKREILADDKLQPVFGGEKLDMFQITKAAK